MRAIMLMTLLFTGVAGTTTATAKNLTGHVENFRLTSHAGRSIELYRLAKSPAGGWEDTIIDILTARA